MKKITLIFITSIVFILCSQQTKAQFGYKYELETNKGISIKYKYAHEKFFNKQSDLNLRLKLKNTTNETLLVKFNVAYETGIKDKKESEVIILEIEAGRAKTGKIHGLNFETGSNDIDFLKSDDFQWYFNIFEVSKLPENE